MKNLDIIKQINQLLSEFINDETENQITLKCYIERFYILFQKNAKKERNFKKILGKLNIIISYEFVNKNMADITENDMINFFNILKKDRKISQTTHNRYRSLLNHIFNTAIKDRIVNTNPVKSIKKYQEKQRDRVLNEIEIKNLLDACKKSKNRELYYIVLIALYTGMRYNNVLCMNKSKILGNIYYLSGDETKSGKSQTIPLHYKLIKELNYFIENNNNGDFIFKSKCVKRPFMTACRRAGIENFRFHDLRRTFATTLLSHNVDLKTIQNMLGHSSIIMTERYLASNSKKELDAINKLCFI